MTEGKPLFRKNHVEMNHTLTPIKLLAQNGKHRVLSLEYFGCFSENLMHSILEISENGLLARGSSSSQSRKISFLLVECFQNIVRHAAPEKGREDQSARGLFAINQYTHHCVINSVNKVKTSRVEEIRNLVDHINSMDASVLKEEYRKKLNATEINMKGGAGLGLIELARKSGSKLQYSFESVDEDFSLFHQQILLHIDSGQGRYQLPDHMAMARATFLGLGAGDVMLEYKGDLSQQIILPIIQWLEGHREVYPQDHRCNKAVLYILTELLQNIMKHGAAHSGKPEGALSMGRHNGEVYISAGNPIPPSKMKSLGEQLDYLTSLECRELKLLHQRALKASVRFENKLRSGLGLIEIVQAAKRNVTYAFEEVGRSHVLFSLGVKL